MPYITQGVLTYCYAIKQRRGRIRNPYRDNTIFIGMSGNKRITDYLEYYTNQVTVGDSLNHQTVRARLTENPNEVFYVKLIDRFKYNATTSRKRVEFYQRKYNAEIPYPP